MKPSQDLTVMRRMSANLYIKELCEQKDVDSLADYLLSCYQLLGAVDDQQLFVKSGQPQQHVNCHSIIADLEQRSKECGERYAFLSQLTKKEWNI